MNIVILTFDYIYPNTFFMHVNLHVDIPILHDIHLFHAKNILHIGIDVRHNMITILKRFQFVRRHTFFAKN